MHIPSSAETSPMRLARALELRSISPASLAVVAIAAGVGLRLLPISSPFPWFDGGLFAQVIDQLRSGPLLPTTVEFNGASIPFVYPPLAFEVATLVARVTGADTLDLLRWLPSVGAVVVLFAFWLATASLFDARVATFGAAIYGLMPSAFDPLVAGGGVTRGLGLALALIAWAGIGRFNCEQRGRWLVATGVAGGLAALTHPMAAVLVATGTAFLVRPAGGGAWRWLRSVAVVGAIAALVILPWLLLVASRGELPALVLGGGQRYQPMTAIVLFLVKLTQPGNLAEAIGSIALFVVLAQRRWSLVAVTAACLLGPGWFYPTIGLAVAAGALLVQIDMSLKQPPSVIARLTLVVVLTLAVFVSTLSALVNPADRLSEPAAMRWVAGHAPVGQQFIVMSSVVWGSNIAAEWFPYVASRESLLTLQGKEWLGPALLERLQSQYDQMRGCVADADPECVHRLAASLDAPEAWLFVAPDAANLRLALLTNSNYRLVFVAGDGAVFAPAPA
jgi:hypothetical protein